MKENIFYRILKRFMVFLLLVVSFVCVSCDKGADKSNLQGTIATVETYNASEYTNDSYAALQEALDKANAVLNNDKATQEEVNKAIEDLNTAINNLVKKQAVSKIALQTYYVRVKDTANAGYTEESYGAFQAAVTAAKAILDKADATQEEVDAALENLRTTFNALAVNQKSRLQNSYNTVKGLQSKDFINYKYYDYVASQVAELKDEIDAVLLTEDGDFELYADKLDKLVSLTKLAANYSLDFSAEQGNNGWNYYCGTSFSWTFPELTFGPQGIYEPEFDGEKYVGDSEQVLSSTIINPGQNHNNKPAFPAWTASESGIFNITFTLDMDIENEQFSKLSVRTLLMDKDGGFKYIVFEGFDLGTGGEKVKVFTAENIAIEAGEKVYFIIHDEGNVATEVKVDITIEACTKYTAILSENVEAYSKIQGKYYEQNSFNVLQTKLQAATELLSNLNSTQAEINAMVVELENAKQALVKVSADKSELEEQITLASALDGDYSKATSDALSAALENAKEVFDNDSATQDQVDAALEELKTAVKGLVNLSELRAKSTLLTEYETSDFASSKYYATYIEQINSVKALVAELLAKEDVTTDEITAIIPVIDDVSRLTTVIADSTIDFSSVQGENGFSYLTHTGNNWDWGTSYGPLAIEELVWNRTTLQYESEYGHALSAGNIVIPQAGNEHNTLVKWGVPNDGTYSLRYNLNVGQTVGTGRLSVRLMLFNADGSFAERMLAETYEIGTNGKNYDVTLNVNDAVLLEGQYVLIVLYDEGTEAASGTFNFRVYYTELYNTKLNALIAKAEAVDGTLYTTASYEALTTALNAAKAQVNATEQTVINSAVHALEAALDGLKVVSISTDELSTEIETAEALLDGDYTAASVAALSAKIDEAKLVVENPESQEAVDAALQAVLVARGQLVDLSALRSVAESLAAVKAEHFVSSTYVEVGMAQVEAAKASVSAILAKEDATKDEVNDQINIANEALTLVHLVADMNQDFSKVQGENGWRYQTNTAHVWDWGANYGPTEIVDLVWNPETQQYESAAGSVVKGNFMAFPQT